MRFQCNVTLLRRMELDVGAELDATECVEVVGAEEPGRDGRREPGRLAGGSRAGGTGGGDASERHRRSPSRERRCAGRACDTSGVCV